MSPEIKTELVSLIAAAKEAGSDAASFIAAQAPDVLSQLVHWKIAEGVAYAAIGCALFYLLYRLLAKLKETKNTDVEVVCAVGGLFVGLAACAFFYLGTTQVIQALVAPKILILETIADLVRK
jgi:hypothetical protein